MEPISRREMLAGLAIACGFGLRQLPAAERWSSEVQQGIVTLRADFQVAEPRALIEHVLEIRAELEQTLQLQSGEQPIEVNLFRNRRNYLQYVTLRVPDGGKRQALFVKGPDAGRVYLYWHHEVETDLKHEGTHAVLHGTLPYLPLWLDEGLAEYFEAPRSQRANGHPHLRSVKWAVHLGWRPRLTSLEEISQLTDFEKNNYRDAWACTHYLLHRSPETRELLISYLQSIQQNRPPGRLSEHLQRLTPGFEQDIANHFRDWKSGS